MALFRRSQSASTAVPARDAVPVHTFDQTNGVLQRYEQHLTHEPGTDEAVAEQARRMIGSAVVQSAGLGGGIL